MANTNWRNFGGIYKSEKLSHINVGTLVADQILLRQTQSTVLLVQGEIDVGANATLHGNLFVFEDSYLKKRLYFGSTVAYAPTDSSSVYLAGSFSGIGINTTTPTSPFDIVGTTPDSTTLTVRSTSITNKNIIAQNMFGRGIAVYTDENSSSINFANALSKSSIINNTASLDLSSTTLRINPRTNSNSSLFNESAVIFDLSWNPYLYNAYQNTSNKTGNALTLVSVDNSSNTALRLVSPNANGLIIKGGGNFPLDASRCYGTIGVNDGCPSINIVSGSSPIKYTSTVGINTFSPRTDKYCLDINGPTRIANGEVSTVALLGFDASFVSFSKRSKAGIVSGGPSTFTTPYQNTIAYTKDGGLTWSNSIIDTTTLSSVAIVINPFTICCYSYDSSYAFVGCTSSYSSGVSPNINAIYYTNNGGANWYKMNDTAAGTSFRFTISCIHAFDIPSTNSKRVFFGGLTSPPNPVVTVFYVDVLNSDLDRGGDYNFAVDGGVANHVTGFSSNFTNVVSCDGSGNDLYYVGNGIQRVNVGNVVADMSYNVGISSINYNNICCYDSSHIIAVGSNIISSTTNGQSWVNTTTHYGVSVLVGHLRDVFIYDTSKAIAVGNGGTMLYTIDGYRSWNPIPSQILNSSGIGSLLTNPNYDLTGIIMPTIDTFAISQVLTKYVSINSTKGSSRILYGFFPALFNSEKNNVFDVCGNMTIGGNIHIVEGGSLFVNRIDVSGTIKVNSVINIASDVSVNTRLFVGGDVSLNNRLTVTGRTVVNDISVNNTLFVNNISGNLYIPDLTVTGNATFNNNTYTGVVAYSPIFDSKSSVLNIGTQGNSTTINIGNFNNIQPKTINIGNEYDTVILNGSVVNNTAVVNTYESKTILLNDTALGTAQSFGSGIYIRDNSNDIAGHFLVSRDMSGYNFKPPNTNSNTIRLDVNSMVLPNGMNTGLVVLKQSSLMGIFDSNYTMTLQNMDVSSIFLRNSALSTDTTQVISSKVTIQGDLSANAKLFVQGDTSLSCRLFISNDVSANSKLFVGQDASLNSRLYVAGNVILAQGITGLSDVSANKRLFIRGDVSLNSRLFVNGDTSFNGTLSVGSDINITGNIFLANNLTMGGTVNFVGLSIGTNVNNPDSTMDISGNIEQLNGAIYQF